MSFYSKPIAYITILAITGFTLPVVKAEEAAAAASQPARKTAEFEQNSSVPSTLAEKFSADATSLPMSTVVTPDTIQWQPGSDLLPVGSKIAILQGDPAKEGPFTMRIKFPANYMVAPHTYQTLENMTVISGTFNFGIGQKFDATKGTVMPIGSFVVIQPGVSHYGWGSEETILQVQGIGPTVKTLVNPTDAVSNNSATSPTATPEPKREL